MGASVCAFQSKSLSICAAWARQVMQVVALLDAALLAHVHLTCIQHAKAALYLVQATTKAGLYLVQGNNKGRTVPYLGPQQR